MLKPVDANIWIAEGTCVNFYGFAYPTRSVIIRLAGGDLWVWSPIEFFAELGAAVDALGPVRHLVSPNKIHYLFLGAWKAAYPDALLWGPQSTIDKCRDLDFQSALGDTPPEHWAGEIDQVRFVGSPLLDEIVFHHRASRTAILADLSENFSEAFLEQNWASWQRPIARLWGIVEGQGKAPLEWRLSFLDRKAARASRDLVLGWRPEKVIMAHGTWQAENGTAFLQRSFAWLD